MTRDELCGAGRPSQPSTSRIHNVSTLSLFNVKWMPRAPLPRARGCFAIQLATSMDITSMDATSMDATRCSESSRDREERLWRRRECERARRAAETAEQRAHRLWQRRERDRARRALQSSERRERELQRMRATSHDRLTAETHSSSFTLNHTYNCMY